MILRLFCAGLALLAVLPASGCNLCHKRCRNESVSARPCCPPPCDPCSGGAAGATQAFSSPGAPGYYGR